MNFISGVLNNKILLAAFWAWLIAQILKTLIYVIMNKNFNPERLLGDGGMPSSHSAFVCSLATAIGLTEGMDSAAFAMSPASCTLLATVTELSPL